MTVFKDTRSGFYTYSFEYRGKRYSGRTGLKTRSLAKAAELRIKDRLKAEYFGIDKDADVIFQSTLKEASERYLEEYKLRHSSSSFIFVTYSVKHLNEHMGDRQLWQISGGTILEYQSTRLKEGAAPKTINDEVGELFRILGKLGDSIRGELKRRKKLNLKTGEPVGIAIDDSEENALLEQASYSKSPHIALAIALSIGTTMRATEVKTLRWSQVDLLRRTVRVGKSKTPAGSGRIIPLGKELVREFVRHGRWFQDKFKVRNIPRDWYVFPFGRIGHYDPSRHVTTLKTAWATARKAAGVKARFHDLRHTAITKLAETNASDQTIKSIAGHVSQRMLEHYSHIRLKAKREAIEEMNRRKNGKEVTTIFTTPSPELGEKKPKDSGFTPTQLKQLAELLTNQSSPDPSEQN